MNEGNAVKLNTYTYLIFGLQVAGFTQDYFKKVNKLNLRTALKVVLFLDYNDLRLQLSKDENVH